MNFVEAISVIVGIIYTEYTEKEEDRLGVLEIKVKRMM